jgi:hypothetical protein
MLMKIPAARLLFLALIPCAFASCTTHVAGVVLGERTEQPATDAEFTIGPPNMIVLDRHHVDRHGHFDFYISGIDETNLYLWNGKGDPAISPRHIDPTEISNHMVLHMSNPYEIQSP